MQACLERLKQYLGEHGAAYEVQHHATAYTAQEVAAALGEKGRHVAKVFIAAVDGTLVMFVLPASLRVDLRRVKEYLGAQEVRRAHEDQFRGAFPDCDVGAMPPFGCLYKMQTYLERSLADQPYIVFQAGSHSDAIKLATADYLRIAAPKIAHFTYEMEPAQ